MTTREAKVAIAKEFIDKYYEWLNDYNNPDMSSREYGYKYGWSRIADTDTMKDTLTALKWFQSHIFSGRYLGGWERVGISKQIAYSLYKESFFSYEYSASGKARREGKSDYYYINLNKAKEIHKAYKDGFFDK